ncbi:hypothetical protein JX265_001224 [Neoarthrinium moseri]|uniref:Uncharacterized protein n=1 Tax=Neoarthrinium moseri TaxID=1658444 RepID=A0A9P9WXT8_9PEZI|nr:uncharacterized protein JN550_007399 [Neoarthrinium moseri]KAI1866852.1 hypothetical protein JN550_007399 [Neoarthrinium moseri]KAI1880984.1 hypothetical protein JX265_001224 [Neoarthrinium moseri]
MESRSEVSESAHKEASSVQKTTESQSAGHTQEDGPGFSPSCQVSGKCQEAEGKGSEQRGPRSAGRRGSPATQEHFRTLQDLEGGIVAGEQDCEASRPSGDGDAVPGDKVGIWEHETAQVHQKGANSERDWMEETEELEATIGSPSNTRYYRTETK